MLASSRDAARVAARATGNRRAASALGLDSAARPRFALVRLATAAGYRTTTPFLGPFLYRELDDAAPRAYPVPHTVTVPACVYLTSAYSNV